jgi:hypothetical protein
MSFVLTPKPTAYAWQAIEYVINQSWNLAQNKSDDFDMKIGATSDFIDNIINNTALAMQPADLATDVGVQEPMVNIPLNAPQIDSSIYQAQVTDMIDKLAALFQAYIAYYFPEDNATNADVEAWLQQVITSGINPAVEMQFYERDRARITTEALRKKQEAQQKWAARGFPLPPGALNGALARIDRDTQKELAASSRSIVLQQVELMKFAVENAIKLRQVALSTAVDYIRALASSITVAQNLAVAQLDAQPKLISAAAQFFEARIRAKSLLLQRDTTDAGFEQEANKTNYQGDLALVEDKVKMLIAQAEAIAHMAAAALNNLHASVSGSTGYSEGGTVNYNYQGDTTPVSPRSWA